MSSNADGARGKRRDSKHVRIQFDVSPVMLDRIDAVVDRLEAASRSEVIRRALLLLDRVTVTNGGTVVLRDADGRETVFA